jgi:hypothetical protein
VTANGGFAKRRRYFVNAGIQGAVVAWVFFIALAVLAFHTWITYARLSSALEAGRSDLPLATLFAQDVFVTIVVMGIFIAVMAIRGSHRIAGPLVRFTQVLKKVQKGDISEQILLRKGDFLVEFAEELNLALANLREIVQADRIALAQAQQRLMGARNRTPYPEIQAELDAALGALSTVCARFELDPEWRRRPGEPQPPPVQTALRRAILLPPPFSPPAAR